MKKFSLLLALLLAGCASPVTKAPWRSYSGALVPNACQRYAKASHADLLCRRVDAYYVVYGWKNGDVTGRHAVTIFRDSAGWWMLDNVAAWPMRIRGNTVMELVKSLDSNAYIIWEAPGVPIPIDSF